MRKLLALVLAGALAGVLAASALAATKTVKVGDVYFVKRGTPQTVTVSKGTTVKWTWVGNLPHNVKVTKGPVKFTSCGFWGVGDTDTHVRVRGSGTVSFSACHFTAWGQTDPAAPCIIALSGGLIVQGSEFMDKGPGRSHIELGKEVESAAITGNRFRAPIRIANQSAGDVQVGLNTAPKE